jgi:glycosyltransferase involved in cell wall biosynthesis
MGVGLCCVVTDVGDAGRLVDGMGIVVPPENPTALGAGLIEVSLMSDGERTAIGRRAQARIEENFSMEAVAGLYSDLYASI